MGARPAKAADGRVQVSDFATPEVHCVSASVARHASTAQVLRHTHHLALPQQEGPIHGHHPVPR